MLTFVNLFPRLSLHEQLYYYFFIFLAKTVVVWPQTLSFFFAFLQVVVEPLLTVELGLKGT